MIKKAMILAAGLGTRLRPLTNILPKPLVPLLDQPLLIYHLKQLANIGVEEVVVNLHYLPEIIKETIPRRRQVGNQSPLFTRNTGDSGNRWWTLKSPKLFRG